MTAVLQSFEFPNENVACEQALLFGQAKRAFQERVSEGLRTPFPSPRGFAARTRILTRLISLAQTGELACWLQKTSLARQAIKLTTEFTRLIAKQG